MLLFTDEKKAVKWKTKNNMRNLNDSDGRKFWGVKYNQ